MFIDARTSKWDSCAGEAIVKAMGGFSIKPNMEAIIYDPNEEYANNEGFIASLSQDVFNEIQDYISTEEFQNFTNLGTKEVEVKGNWSSQNSKYYLIFSFLFIFSFFQSAYVWTSLLIVKGLNLWIVRIKRNSIYHTDIESNAFIKEPKMKF